MAMAVWPATINDHLREQILKKMFKRILLVAGCCCSLSVLATESPDFFAREEPQPEPAESIGDRLWQLDQQVQRHPVAIQPHKRNYFLASYFDSNFAGLASEVAPFENALDRAEIKFQISIRVPVVENFLGTKADLYGAYTSKALWQAFNSDSSSPFRDINHEPEMFLLWPTRWQLGPMHSRAVSFGINHQSNGQINQAQAAEDGTVIYESLSRSWNRIMLGAYFEQKHFFWHLQAWYRIPEKEKTDPEQAKGDDNPDIERYLGNFELTMQRMIGRYSGTMRLRNNLNRRTNRGAVQFDITFPLTRKLNGVVQVFHGYGESLLDYNSRNTRVGVGFTFRGL